MNMSAVFITRPVAPTLLMAGILIFGLLRQPGKRNHVNR